MKKLLVFILMLLSLSAAAQYDSIKVSTPGSGLGDNLRTAGKKMNALIEHANTIELYNISQPEMAILNGALVSTTELNRLVGLSSAVQTQLNSKVNATDTAAMLENYLLTSEAGSASTDYPEGTGIPLVAGGTAWGTTIEVTSAENYSTENYNATGTGDIVMSIGATMISPNITNTPVATGTVVAGTGITSAMLSRFMYFSTAAAINITSNPQIANGTSGQIITIIGSSDTNTLTLDDTDGLRLSAQCVLGIGDTITLLYEGTIGDWIEISRSAN